MSTPREQAIDRIVAQLRHAYHNLIGPDVSWDREQRMRFADGLIAPQIVALETLAAVPDAPRPEGKAAPTRPHVDQVADPGCGWCKGTGVVTCPNCFDVPESLPALKSPPAPTSELTDEQLLAIAEKWWVTAPAYYDLTPESLISLMRRAIAEAA